MIYGKSFSLSLFYPCFEYYIHTIRNGIAYIWTISVNIYIEILFFVSFLLVQVI